MNLTTHPLPKISPETYDRNLDRNPEIDDRCERCGRALTHTAVEVATMLGAEAIDADEYRANADTLPADPGFSGIYLLGASCARKVPARFRLAEIEL